jgi:leucyl-tRNA synthetase
MTKYNHKKTEKKWQTIWEKEQPWKATEDASKEKFYALIEFPYPSGAGLHVGHVRSNTAMDIICRKRRAEGYNVLYPIGWDAFGLPTENYAIKTGIHPAKVTKQNTDTFRKQLKKIGFSFDWSREVDTTDPEYYKWTQWIFLKLYEKGLAYKAKKPINWCLSCKIGLANEEVVDGACERCGGEVEKREKEQWMLAITKYANRLYDDLDEVNFLEKIKIQQRNWIGKSEGSEIKFPISNSELLIDVFTTRPDTLFGATYMVLAPEHTLVQTLRDKIENWDNVADYIKETGKKTEIDRTAEGKEKTGVELKGVRAINPANKEEIPVFVADYVLADYGTGAIMAVPAHDERDSAFAQKYNLPIQPVIEHNDGGGVYTRGGILKNSGEFDGMNSEEAKKAITEFVEGETKTTYKLRDWVFSRQRYWGEPIPMVHCGACGIVPLPENELPLKLPDVEKYEPTDTGESPLAAITDWVNTTCPKCGGAATRETDTMPNWAGSSWYFLRYTDPHNAKALAGEDALAYWTPIDWYNGGMEHTTLHLLYSRFWHKFLFDLGVVPTGEPYAKRTSHGMILAEGGVKMSKSKGNVINPDDIVESVGADALRVYEMFMGPFDQAISWSRDAMVGSRRWLDRIWNLQEKVIKEENQTVERELHKLIKKVSADIEDMKFNTAIAAMMTFTNLVEKEGLTQEQYKVFVKLLSPFAPHITEELTELLGTGESVHMLEWPHYDAEKIIDDTVTIALQVNGKVRATLDISPDETQENIEQSARALPQMEKWLGESETRKVIYVPGKLINFVV